MQIRTLLTMAVSLSILMVMGLGGVVWVANGRLEQVYDVQYRTQSIASEVSALLILTHEYALHGEQRALQQWRSRQGSIVRNLQVDDDEQAALRQEALTQAAALPGFFDQLVAARHGEENDLQRRRTRLLLDQLLTHTQALSDSVGRWSVATAESRKVFEHWFNILVILVPLAMLLMLAALALLLVHRLLRPLARLRESVMAVAQGDLSKHCAIDSPDELGLLSRTFDAMAVDLVNQLRAREGLLRQILDTSSVAIFLVDMDGRVSHANQRMAEMFGWPLSNLIGMEYVELVRPDEREVGRTNLLLLMRSHMPSLDLERTYLRRDQSEFWGHLSCKRFFDVGGEEKGLVGVISDISSRKQAEQALRESEERFRNALECAPIGMALLSLEGRFVQVNRALSEILDRPAQALLGLAFDSFTHPDDRHKDEAFRVSLASGAVLPHEVEQRFIRRDGQVVWVQITASLLRDENGQPNQVIQQVQEITERKLLEQQLERQARTDFLTGLANRRHFLEQAEQELGRVRRYNKPLTMVMLDLDCFKEINDTYGHEVGDRVLKELARVCRGMLRELDVMGRMGGEEFAILLPETSSDRGWEVAERLREAIADTEIAMAHGLPIHFTASFGLTSFQEADINIDILLNRADRALYQAKHLGRNRVCQFDPSI